METGQSLKDERELQDALRKGCRTTFTAIYNEYWYPMFLLAYRKIENKEAAEEIVQDIFTTLWRDREQLEISNLGGYLFTSVRYEIIDYIRRNIRREGYQRYYKSYGLYKDISTEDTVFYNDLLSSINRVMIALPGKTREIFRYRRMEQWPVAKIAKQMGITEKTVEYHLTRATRFMKDALKEHLATLAGTILYFSRNFLQ